MIADPPVAIRDALEPASSDVKKHPAYLRRPRSWDVDTLYVFYDAPPTYRQVETDPACQRLEFALRAVYIVDPLDEEPQQERREDVDAVIAAKLDDYAGILAGRTGIPHAIALTGWSADPAYFTDFNRSGLSLLINGYQLP